MSLCPFTNIILVNFHDFPPSSEIYNPFVLNGEPFIPTATTYDGFLGSIENVPAPLDCSPAFDCSQFLPPSSERYIPPTSVPYNNRFPSLLIAIPIGHWQPSPPVVTPCFCNNSFETIGTADHDVIFVTLFLS